MMFINAIVAAAILAASVITATPAELVARANTIKLCNDVNYYECDDNAAAEPGVCRTLSNNFSALGGNKRVSSLDTRNFKCRFYVDAGCVTNSGFLDFTGNIGNFETHDGGKYKQFQDNLSSYKCD